MMFFVQQGYQVIAHDRRGHGRFPQGLNGHDMNTCMSGVVELTDSLDLHEAVRIGHSTGSGEVARHVARDKPDISGERMPIASFQALHRASRHVTGGAQLQGSGEEQHRWKATEGVELRLSKIRARLAQYLIGLAHLGRAKVQQLPKTMMVLLMVSVIFRR